MKFAMAIQVSTTTITEARESFPGAVGNIPDDWTTSMPQQQSTATVPSLTHLSLGRDTLMVVTMTLLVGFLAVRFEFNEIVYAATRRWEGLQLDELPVVCLTLALGLAWVLWRLYKQALAELSARLVAEQRLAEALSSNRQLTHEHLRIQESERKHLARELHDELGQYLNAIKLDALALGEYVEGDAGAADAAERIVSAVNRVHNVVNDMIRRLRPAGLDELGLVAALESCVDQWRRRLPATAFTLSADDVPDDLGELTSLTLYRLIQEGLTNIYKHAAARRVEISLRREATGLKKDVIVLTLQDDGRGSTSPQSCGGFGLSGMRERVAMMGGMFLIDNVPEHGFRVEARLPVTESS